LTARLDGAAAREAINGMKSLQSKLIEGLNYHRETRQLTIYFIDGHIAQFIGVPEGVVLGLEIAASPGDYYMSQIRTTYPRL
jgi:hypothetical protein